MVLAKFVVCPLNVVIAPVAFEFHSGLNAVVLLVPPFCPVFIPLKVGVMFGLH